MLGLVTKYDLYAYFEDYRVFKEKKGGGGMITWSQLGLQDAASPIIEEFIFFHDFTLVILAFILRLVAYILFISFTGSGIRVGLLEGQLIEGL